jgi:hypothetical protein
VQTVLPIAAPPTEVAVRRNPGLTVISELVAAIAILCAIRGVCQMPAVDAAKLGKGLLRAPSFPCNSALQRSAKCCRHLCNI